VLVVDRNQVARPRRIRNCSPAAPETAMPARLPVLNPLQPEASPSHEEAAPTVLDWSHESRQSQSAQDDMRLWGLGSGCTAAARPGRRRSAPARVCRLRQHETRRDKRRLRELVTSLSIGRARIPSLRPWPRADLHRQRKAAQGTMTIICQDVNRHLRHHPESAHAPARRRTLAINTDDGEVYLVTDYVG